MAKKENRISVNAFEKAVKENCEDRTTVQWGGLEIEVKHTLELGEMVKFVELAVRACFTDKDMEYRPQMKDCAIRMATVSFYTNLNLPQNVDKAYGLIVRSHIIQTIMPHIERSQFDAMIDSIDDILDNIASANATEIIKAVNDTRSAMDEIKDGVAELFGGLEAGDMENFVKAVTEGGLDEEKFIKSYLANGGAHE